MQLQEAWEPAVYIKRFEMFASADLDVDAPITLHHSALHGPCWLLVPVAGLGGVTWGKWGWRLSWRGTTKATQESQSWLIIDLDEASNDQDRNSLPWLVVASEPVVDRSRLNEEVGPKFCHLRS
jgi:hypothetical protein